MVDLTTMPESELRDDLKACRDDIIICSRCILFGITHHRDGFPVQERLETNQKIANLIEGELRRRRGQQCSTKSTATE